MSPDDKARAAGQKTYISGNYKAVSYYTDSGILNGKVHDTFNTPTKPSGPVTYNTTRGRYVYTDNKGVTWEAQSSSPATKWRVAGNADDVARADAKQSQYDPNGSFGQRLQHHFHENTFFQDSPAAFIAETTTDQTSNAIHTIIGGAEALGETIIEEFNKE